MTRFLYIADTHLGADPMGYQQQEGFPGRLPEILGTLVERMADLGGVDFVLHGGDMVDSTTDDNILAAGRAFDLPVPVYLCLGNHDLTVPDAVERWMDLAPQFFPDNAPDFTVVTEDCVIHVAPNHWCEHPFYWRDRQEARLSESQVARLARDIALRPGRPHLLVTHSPVYGLPPAQTGLDEPCHSPNASFTAAVEAFLADRAEVACVLGAHNHMNMRVTRGGVEFVTVSSLVETPFELKLFEVTRDSVRMQTVGLRDCLSFGDAYDASRAYVQGRPVDRSFHLELGPHRTVSKPQAAEGSTI